MLPAGVKGEKRLLSVFGAGRAGVWRGRYKVYDAWRRLSWTDLSDPEAPRAR